MSDPTSTPTEPIVDPKPSDPAPDTTDWKAEARKWEARAKENANAADKIAALEEAQKTELQKALDEAAELKTRVAGFEMKERTAAWAAEIVKDSDIPASVLRGTTRDELEQHFEQLKNLAPKPKRTSAPTGRAAGDTGESRAVAALRQLGLGSD